jgi:hypothetical protein
MYLLYDVILKDVVIVEFDVFPSISLEGQEAIKTALKDVGSTVHIFTGNYRIRNGNTGH